MRKVKIMPEQSPPDDWVAEAEAVTDRLRIAATKEERAAIIKSKEALWRDDRIREWLKILFHRKCWYSESRESVSSYHVDHYRPKGRVSGNGEEPSEGYWWLAFEWKNYRIAGQLLNVKKLDLFPIVEGFAANPDDPYSLELEAPILLDPTTDDAGLITFDRVDDGCLAEPSVLEECRDRMRAEKSIEILGLNRLPELKESRAMVWDKCKTLIEKYRDDRGPQCIVALRKSQAIQSLKEKIQYSEEFSSVALAAIEKIAPQDLRVRVLQA